MFVAARWSGAKGTTGGVHFLQKFGMNIGVFA